MLQLINGIPYIIQRQMAGLLGKPLEDFRCPTFGQFLQAADIRLRNAYSFSSPGSSGCIAVLTFTHHFICDTSHQNSAESSLSGCAPYHQIILIDLRFVQDHFAGFYA